RREFTPIRIISKISVHFSLPRLVLPDERLRIRCRGQTFQHHPERVENRGTDWQPYLRPALCHSMDRLGTRAKECNSLWVLGMQRARLDFNSRLFRHLSA